MRDLLVRYLGGEGYEVKAAADAAAMDKLLARERYDLVVLDLMLPGEDGLAVCRRLRAQGAGPAIIMLTAKGDDVDRIVGLEMGADDYLPKPFNPRELLVHGLGLGHRLDVVALAAEIAHEQIAQALVVVDDEDPGLELRHGPLG